MADEAWKWTDVMINQETDERNEDEGRTSEIRGSTLGSRNEVKTRGIFGARSAFYGDGLNSANHLRHMAVTTAAC